jgi:hypothetical protein
VRPACHECGDVSNVTLVIDRTRLGEYLGHRRGGVNAYPASTDAEAATNNDRNLGTVRLYPDSSSPESALASPTEAKVATVVPMYDRQMK